MTPAELPPPVPETLSTFPLYEFTFSAEEFEGGEMAPPRPNGPPRPTREELAEDRRAIDEWLKRGRPPQN